MKKSGSPESKGVVHEALTYVISAAAGVVSMWGAVRSYAHRNLRKTSILKPHYDKHVQDLAKISVDEPDYLKKINNIEKEYSGHVREAYKKVGIEEGEGFKTEGFRQIGKSVRASIGKFRSPLLSKFEKSRVLGFGLAVSSVTLGAIIGLSRRHTDKLETPLGKVNREGATQLSI